MWLEGPEPPRVSDNGWVGRRVKNPAEAEGVGSVTPAPEEEQENSKSSRGGRDGRGRRVGRGDGRKGRSAGREDNRKVLTEVIYKNSPALAVC